MTGPARWEGTGKEDAWGDRRKSKRELVSTNALSLTIQFSRQGRVRVVSWDLACVMMGWDGREGGRGKERERGERETLTMSSARTSRPLWVRTTRSPFLPGLSASEAKSRRSPRIVQTLSADRVEMTVESDATRCVRDRERGSREGRGRTLAVHALVEPGQEACARVKQGHALRRVELCDVSSELSVQQAFRKVMDTYGRIDSVVASAGPFSIHSRNSKSKGSLRIGVIRQALWKTTPRSITHLTE